jgi:outer membrane protein assembly factor BamB
MRKSPLAAMAVIAALSFVACAPPESKEAPAREDVLFLRTSRGITLVSAVSEASAVRLSDAVPSTDWSAVVQAVQQGEQTRIEAFDTSSGHQLWAREAPGNLEVKVASKDGRMVVLGNPRVGGTGYPAGRSFTKLVVIDQESAEPRIFELQGNYEPEAFSTDGGSLFVIQYLPPRSPTSYRVRRLDLRRGDVVGVYTVDAELQEAMQGTARIQAASPDGRRLYTLYTIDGATTRHAFVHVLSLDDLWAHCVDLPSTFGTASEREIALSVTPDGTRLYVADGSSGTVAEVDTEALAVTRIGDAALGSHRGALHAVSGPDGTLYLGKGKRLVALDPSRLSVMRSWDIQERITGMQPASDGGRLYVGVKHQIVILDTASGTRLGELDPANMGKIRQLGQTTRELEEERTEIVCAC